MNKNAEIIEQKKNKVSMENRKPFLKINAKIIKKI